MVGIVDASREQSERILEVNTGVNQMNQATQQTAASAEELAGAAEQLSRQAEQMSTMAWQFKLSRQHENQIRAVVSTSDPAGSHISAGLLRAKTVCHSLRLRE